MLKRYYWEYNKHNRDTRMMCQVFDRKRSGQEPIAEAVGTTEAQKLVDAMNALEDGKLADLM